MKYLISITAIMFSQILFSQDLQYTIDYINKIYEKERTFFETSNHYYNAFAPIHDFGIMYLIGDSMISTPNEKILKNPHINRKYEKQVLDYLQNYMFDSLPNIQRVTFDLIYSTGYYSKKKKTRRRTVNMLLDMVCLPLVNRDDLIGFKKEDFNKKAREKLKDVIRGVKPDTAIYYSVEYSIRTRMKNKFDDDEIRYICKRDSLPYEYVRDSIFEHRKQHDIKSAKRWLPGHTFIRLAGKIYMYDFVPELKQMLKDKRYGGKRYDIKCALARMGDTVIEKQLLSSRSFDDYEYINTQRALSKLIEELYTDEMHDCYANGWLIVPLSNYIHLRLQDWILNFPEELKIDKFGDSFTKEDLKKVENAKIWLKENRDKLKPDPDAW